MRLDTPLGLLFLLLLLLAALSARCQEIPRPDHSEHARLARWLVHYNSWGTLSTQGEMRCEQTGGVAHATSAALATCSGVCCACAQCVAQCSLPLLMLFHTHTHR